MSSRLGWSLGVVGAVLIVSALCAFAGRRDTPKARARMLRGVSAESEDWLVRGEDVPHH